MRRFPVLITASRLNIVLLTIFAISTLYLLHQRRVSCPSPTTDISLPFSTFTTTTTTTTTTTPTTVYHLVFSIASSSKSLLRRLPYISLWNSPNSTRPLIFLDSLPSSTPKPALPNGASIVLSADTSRFPYSFPRGLRSAIRVARIVKEAVDRVGPSARWFVFGDDDTVFVPDNLVAVLSKYDHEKWYYIGSVSESLDQNVKISFGMAYGGGGFAISAPLARVLARVLDSCLMRYGHVYGSDSRISSCVSELGVGLTIEPGFHQLDVRGDVFGLLTAHPWAPLLSLHHLDVVEPIFPHMNSTEAMQHLFKSVHVDPGRVLQQTVCYDRPSNMTVSIAWGYAVQVYEGNQLLPNMLALQRTFTPWKRRSSNDASQYVMDTREYARDHCKRPVIFFLKDVAFVTGRTWSKYTRHTSHSCRHDDTIRNLKVINVFAKKPQQGVKEVMAPRRDCCDITSPIGKSMIIDIRHCGSDELIAMNV